MHMRFTNPRSGTHTGESADAHAEGTPVAAVGAALVTPASAGADDEDDAASGDEPAGAAAGVEGVEAPHATRVSEVRTRT